MSYEEEQSRLLRLLNEVDTDEEGPDDEEEDDEIDHIEKRLEDSETEQEADSDIELIESVGPQFIGKDGVTKWNKHPPSQRVRTRKCNLVTRLPHVKGVAKDAKTPLDCWKLFFTDEMLDSIVENTNKYIDNISANYTRKRDARPTNLGEIKALIGLLYLAGCLKGSRLSTEELWNRQGTGVELYWLTMSIQRFRFLLRAMRTDDKETRHLRQQTDKLAAIRTIFDSFVENCKTYYHISEYATVDEKLEAFRGRCGFRQYIPSKPNKYGIKIFALVDAKMFYTLNMEVYVGTQPEGPFQKRNDPESIIERLIQPISNSGRNITTDNWFTTYDPVENLSRNHSITLVGTIRKNKRQLPSEFVNTKSRPSFSSMFGFQKNQTIVSYVPRKGKNVILVSSMHFDDTIDDTTRDKKKPEIVTFYNSTKSGVDVVDKLGATYNVARNTRRWPMVILYALLNVAGINSQIIYTANNLKSDIPGRHYLKTLARELIDDHQKERSMMTNIPPAVKRRRQDAAGTSQDLSSREPREGTRKRCEECSGKDNKTKYYCKNCFKFLCLSHANIFCGTCQNKYNNVE